MTVTISSNMTSRSYFWTDWKAVRSSKAGIGQYDDDGSVYTIWFYDQPEVHVCTIWKGAVPDGVLAVYSQVQNDADKTDFETSFKAGFNTRISRTDAWGNPVSDPIELAAAFGLLPGMKVDRVTGYVGTSTAASYAIRATTYTPQGADGQRSIASSNANDTAAGTGARKIRVVFLNTAMVEKEEIVTLNGTTGVNMAALDVALLQKMEATEVGSNGGNVGTISIYTQINKGGSVWGSIAAGESQTYWAHHYVPAGKTCYILNVSVGSTVVGGWATVQKSGNPMGANLPQRSIAGTYPHQILGMADHSFRIPLAVQGPDFFWLVDRAAAATASTAYGTFEYIEA